MDIEQCDFPMLARLRKWKRLSAGWKIGYRDRKLEPVPVSPNHSLISKDKEKPAFPPVFSFQS
jgi:hypothetical protein